MKIRESYGSRRYEEEYRAALEKSVHYFRQNSCITELRKMGYAQTKLQVEYEAEEYGKSEICCLDAETNTFFNSESAEKFIAENDLSKCENVNIYGDIRQIYCFGYDDKKVVYALTESDGMQNYITIPYISGENGEFCTDISSHRIWKREFSEKTSNLDCALRFRIAPDTWPNIKIKEADMSPDDIFAHAYEAIFNMEINSEKQVEIQLPYQKLCWNSEKKVLTCGKYQMEIKCDKKLSFVTIFDQYLTEIIADNKVLVLLNNLTNKAKEISVIDISGNLGKIRVGEDKQLVSFIQSAQYAKISFMRINEIHQLKDEDDSSPVISNSLSLPVDKSLYLKNVSFQYSRNAPLVLKNITLQIPKGKVTAIVGDSGCGKSTLLKLLLRLYMPSYGEICMGDMNVNNISLRNWRAKCGCVMQDGKLFNDTIQNNIVLDDANIDYEALQKAVEVANISHEIEAMPQGYQTMIGEMGRGLSGGQRQRVLIARALYKDPDYLFLDEATNALDTINEQKIVRALNNVFKNRTVIVVAHRLSTIRRADQIIVLKAGMIIETGNHQSLMTNKQYYYNLIQSQYEPETNTFSTEESAD